MIQFLKAHGLCTELNVVLLFVPQLAVLVFHRVEPNRELRRGNPAAGRIFHGFNEITFSGNPQQIRKNRIFKQLDLMAPALDALGVDAFVLLASLGRVGALQPDLLVQQQTDSSWTLA